MAKVALSTLAGQQLYLDANILIYAVERHPDYVQILDALFGLIDTAQVTAVTSELTLAECLVKPFADNDAPRQQLYQAALSPRPGFSLIAITRDILIRAAQLRALHKPRLPDAIHVATALESNCDCFLTNDQLIRPIPGITIHQLADVTV